jgi:hypothetical protein
MSRTRNIVVEAADQAGIESVYSWLFLDERGTWERRAEALLKRTQTKAEQLSIGGAEQDKQISVFLCYEATVGMLEFENKECIRKPQRAAAREAERQRIRDDHPPLTRGTKWDGLL